MEDEIVLQEKLMLLEAQYDYLWSNLYSSSRSTYGHSRKEMLSELSKEISYYKNKLDRVRTLNQTEATLDMYRSLINQYDNDTPEALVEQNLINEDIQRLEESLIKLQQPNDSILLN